MPGRNEDVDWRCFEKSKAEGKNYYVGKCKACSLVVSGVCLTSWPMLTMYSFAGITERLRVHANECDKVVCACSSTLWVFSILSYPGTEFLHNGSCLWTKANKPGG